MLSLLPCHHFYSVLDGWHLSHQKDWLTCVGYSVMEQVNGLWTMHAHCKNKVVLLAKYLVTYSCVTIFTTQILRMQWELIFE